MAMVDHMMVVDMTTSAAHRGFRRDRFGTVSRGLRIGSSLLNASRRSLSLLSRGLSLLSR